MAVSAVSYRSGPVKYLVGESSGEVSSGGIFLNNNFTELYDMVRPSSSISGELVSVPGYDACAPYAIRTFALPNPNTLGSGKYVATYQNGDVSWDSYNTGGGGGCSELSYPGGNATHYYCSGSYWYSDTSSLQGFRKTYKELVRSSSVDITIPSFGEWLITGTILFIDDAYSGSSYNSGHLYRVNIFGSEDNDVVTVTDTYTGSAWSTDTSGTKLSVSSSGNDVITITDNYSGYNSALIDITVLGGGGIKYGASIDLTNS